MKVFSEKSTCTILECHIENILQTFLCLIDVFLINFYPELPIYWAITSQMCQKYPDMV